MSEQAVFAEALSSSAVSSFSGEKYGNKCEVLEMLNTFHYFNDIFIIFYNIVSLACDSMFVMQTSHVHILVMVAVL